LGLYEDTKICQPYFLPHVIINISGNNGEYPDDTDTPKCVEDYNDGN
jgi:hypothetical protein